MSEKRARKRRDEFVVYLARVPEVEAIEIWEIVDEGDERANRDITAEKGCTERLRISQSFGKWLMEGTRSPDGGVEVGGGMGNSPGEW